ncbi:MAG: 2-C-methyl-D-erythritol 4-phosphate cytidylyltransferase [Lachnospiraceae bacterium]|nr:2-C-methyl-D-erythritol 4-phosphate cytidylyltransferase [Lachnospiraceae bacterium]
MLMIDGKTIAAVIVAGGKGLRMGGETPKQYLIIASDIVLAHTLAAFNDSQVDAIVVVCPPGDEDYVKQNVIRDRFPKVKQIVGGGEKRFDSSYVGIKAACELFDQTPDYVMIHDGVRPLVTPVMINSVGRALISHPAVCLGVRAKETMRQVGPDEIAVSVPDRDSLRVIQTPQGFETKLILEAYERFFADAKEDPARTHGVTDDAMLAERYMQQPVFVAEGSYENIKITTPEDLFLAEAIFSRRN